MVSKDFEAIVCTVAYYFLRGVACELKNSYHGGRYETEPIAILSPMGDIIGYEINGKMMRAKKMRLAVIDENSVYSEGVNNE